MACGVLLRLCYLAQPIRYDEAITYLHFVRKPFSDALSDYSYPNNHLFHTLLAKISITMFGDSPVALRLPAFVAGTLTMPAAYTFARDRFDAQVALLTTALVAGSGALALYSTNARGYSFVILAALVLATIVSRALQTPTRGLWIAYAVVAGLGLWTIPIMLYPMGGVTAWYLTEQWLQDESKSPASLFKRATPVLIANLGAAVIALVCYAPILLSRGAAPLTANKFVTPSTLEVFLSDLAGDLTGTEQLFTLGLPTVLLLLLVALTIAGLLRVPKSELRTMSYIPAVLGWCALLLVVTHRSPFPRIWLFLLPLLLPVVALAFRQLLEREGAPLIRRVGGYGGVALALTLMLSAFAVHSGAVPASLETGTLPDAEAVVRKLDSYLQEGDRVLAPIPANGPVSYWMDRLAMDPRYLTLRTDSARRFFLIINTGEGEDVTTELTRIGVADTTRFAPPHLVAEFPRATLVEFHLKESGTP